MSDTQCAQADPHYVGGISPLALLQKNFRIFIDRHALLLERMYLSAGQRGANLNVAVADLLKVTGAKPVETTRPE